MYFRFNTVALKFLYLERYNSIAAHGHYPVKVTG